VFDSEKIDEKTPIPPPDWEALIDQIAEEIIQEHSPARILQVRAKLYDLLSHCIPATAILKVWFLEHQNLATDIIDSYIQTYSSAR
jgi:hypothetical protein